MISLFESGTGGDVPGAGRFFVAVVEDVMSVQLLACGSHDGEAPSAVNMRA